MDSAIANNGGWKNSGFASVGGQWLPALFIAAAAAMLVVPVPSWLVDPLLVLNICIGLTLLLLAVKASGTLSVAALPTMLLVATLFRLALNVSTTRLILSKGDAGDVVRAFGEFVSGGNPLVGGVLFLILTIVQFIVIAKGSERVAEVTARFTLDAMPGKQMSIDADLRSGLVDAEGARIRRMELERESQFHGAMDGAMKFVKGDAVAGLVINAVNLLGGLAVGCIQLHMPASKALGTYTVLTIGDGLVSQIPALLVAVAAGLVVTRVRGKTASTSLAHQLASPLRSHPQVLTGAGVGMFMIGLVPGMPTGSFCITGITLASFGFWILRKSRSRGNELPDGHKDSMEPRVTIVLPQDLSPDESLPVRLEQSAIWLGSELGLPAPKVELLGDGPFGRWTMFVDGTPAVSGELPKDASRSDLEKELGGLLRLVAGRLIGVQETQNMLDELERSQPALVREVVPRLVPAVLLSEILTRLVEESVPVRDLRGILACLAEWARTEADPVALTERVREYLRPVISHRVAPDGTLHALLLDPEVEQMLTKGMQNESGFASLTISPQDGDSILQGVGAVLDSVGDQAQVVVCRPGIRRPFWKLVHDIFPHIQVVSFMELEPSMSLVPVGVVGLAQRSGR